MAKRKFDREQILSFLKLIEEITLAESPEQALQELMKNAAEVLDAEQACILLTAANEANCLKIECGFEQKARPKGWRVELKREKHPNLYKAMFEEPVFIRPAQAGEDINQVLYIRLETEEMRGVIVFGAKGEKRFDDNDIAIAQAISHLATASIQHAKTIQRNERLSQRMTLADRIKNPLTSALGFIWKIYEKSKEERGEKILEYLNKGYLEKAVKEAERVEKLLGELLKTK